MEIAKGKKVKLWTKILIAKYGRYGYGLDRVHHKRWASWLLDTPLSEVRHFETNVDEMEKAVAKLWIVRHGWRWEEVHNSIPEDTHEKTRAFCGRRGQRGRRRGFLDGK